MARLIACILGMSAVLVAQPPVAEGATDAQSDVFVVHAIAGDELGLDPALPVDVSVNGACALPNFTFGEIVGPLPFNEGVYDITISLADEVAPCSNGPVIDAPGVEIGAGKSYSIVANLTADGAPTASVFENDVSSTDGKARVLVHHAAAAGTVNVKLKRFWPWWFRPLLIENFSNGEQAAAMVNSGRWYASILPSGEDDGEGDYDDGSKYGSRDRDRAVFGPVPLMLEADLVYLIYAAGSLENDTFTLLVQAIEPMAAETSAVYVLHAINGADLGLDPTLPVDVAVNGACAIPGFTFGEFLGPLPFDAGTYDLAIGLANVDDPCGEDPVIEAAGVEIAGGATHVITANLTEDGAPAANVFTTDLKTDRYKGRLDVFHLAAAPAVDIELQRKFLRWIPPKWLYGVANGQQDSVDLFRGYWNATVFPAEADDAVLGPATLGVQRDTVYFVFAVGSLANGTLDLLVEPLAAE